MTAQNQNLCERCRERPATYFICCANTGKSEQLCEQCYRGSLSPEDLASTDRFRDIVEKGKCKYCGTPAKTGCGSFWSFSFQGEFFDLSCKACNEDLADFYQRPENAMPDVPDYEAAFRNEEFMKKRMQEHTDLERRKEEFMRQRISERKSKG